MATKITDLQVRLAKFDKNGMIDRNHWSKNLAIKPEIFEAPHRKMFASRTMSYDFSKGNMLEGIFGLGKTKYIDDLEWTWKLNVEGYRPITILENLTPGDKPGQYRQPIRVIVDADLGVKGETWSPGSSDKSQVAVIKDKQRNGSRGFVYTLMLYTENENHYLKPHYLKPGHKWHRMYTMRGEAAESGGHAENSTDIAYKNRLVKLRKEYKVTDYGGQAVVDIALKDDDGNISRSWMDLQEAQYNRLLNYECAKLAMYSRIGDKPLIDPDSKRPISPGAGIQQQIEFGGITQRYTNMSVELIEAVFDRVAFSRISPGELGEVVAFSGWFGIKEFERCLREWTKSQDVVIEGNLVLDKDPSSYHQKGLSTGYAFTRLRLPTGGSIRLIYNPLYDDKKIHSDIDPLTGKPLESQRVTILDVTGGNMESLNPKNNIRLVRKNKVLNTTIIEGRVGPGGIPSKNPTHAGDWYEVHMSDSIGVEITDPTGLCELIKSPSIVY